MILNTDTKKDKNEEKINELISDYINQLNPIEQKVLKIAERELQSSFDIQKSIGFIEWLDENKK